MNDCRLKKKDGEWFIVKTMCREEYTMWMVRSLELCKQVTAQLQTDFHIEGSFISVAFDYRTSVAANALVRDCREGVFGVYIPTQELDKIHGFLRH